jgi:hypothetical protein
MLLYAPERRLKRAPACALAERTKRRAVACSDCSLVSIPHGPGASGRCAAVVAQRSTWATARASAAAAVGPAPRGADSARQVSAEDRPDSALCGRCDKLEFAVVSVDVGAGSFDQKKPWLSRHLLALRSP